MGENRGIRIALIGLIVLACIAGGWFQIDRSQTLQGTYENKAREQADDYRDRAAKEIFDSCYAGPANIREACINKANETARDQEREEYDLEAQRITAAWTAAMGSAAIIGMFVGIVGVTLVWMTFQETRRSANESQRQADYFINNERPHLRVRPMSLSGKPSEMTIQAIAENYGASPAILTDFVWCLSATDKFPGEREFERHSLTTYKASPKIEAGKHVNVGPIKGSMVPGFIGGRVRFSSRFSPDHEAFFLWELIEVENGELRLTPQRPNHNRGWPKEA